MPKMKTKSGAKKRLRVRGSGSVKRGQAFRRHILTKKSTKNKRQLRVCGSSHSVSGAIFTDGLEGADRIHVHTAPDSDEAQAIAKRHVAWLTGIPGTPAAAPGGDVKGYVIGLGEMYVADPRFGANYATSAGDTAGAEFVRDALRVYAEANCNIACRRPRYASGSRPGSNASTARVPHTNSSVTSRW